MRVESEPLNKADFDPKRKYSPAELEEWADAWLLVQRKEERAARREKDQPEPSTQEMMEQTMMGLFEEPESEENGPEYPWLNADELHRRHRREIYSSTGSVDPSVVEGLYVRTHPQGRKVNSKKSRAKGASFYRS